MPCMCTAVNCETLLCSERMKYDHIFIVIFMGQFQKDFTEAVSLVSPFYKETCLKTQMEQVILWA